MKFERTAVLDKAIDTDTGEFDMVMASEGEATDGHIVSIAGLEFPSEFPLQLDHNRSTSANLGNVTNMRRDAHPPAVGIYRPRDPLSSPRNQCVRQH